MDKYVNVAGMKKESLIDGPGISFVIFFQGCLQNCPGCHNPETRHLEGGLRMSIDGLLKEISSARGIDTVVFSGGEPFLQAVPLSFLAGRLKDKGFRLVVYSGYTYEFLNAHSTPQNCYSELLKLSDILIDGPYIEEKKDLNLAFRGSRNQRILDIPASLKKGEPVGWLGSG